MTCVLAGSSLFRESPKQVVRLTRLGLHFRFLIAVWDFVHITPAIALLYQHMVMMSLPGTKDMFQTHDQ